jgi:hypothetical protein
MVDGVVLGEQRRLGNAASIGEGARGDRGG